MAHIGNEFMRLTRMQELSPSPQEDHHQQPPLEWIPSGLGEAIPLQGQERPAPEFHALVTNRRSLREYTRVPLQPAELSFLLWASQGVKKIVPGKATFRCVPSAGARHPLETFVLINRVENIPSGLYWFDALNHQLKAFKVNPVVAEDLVKACLEQEFVRQSAVTFFWAAIAERTSWRYSERSWRYFFLDAGHACQNLYLAAESIDCGACGIAAYDDDSLNKLLGLDGSSQFTVYAASVGKR